MGRKKLTIDEINSRLKHRGITFIDDFYVNNKYMHNFKCSKGHIWQTKVNGILGKEGYGCHICSKKHTLKREEIELELLDREITFLRHVAKRLGSVNIRGEFSCSVCGNIWDTPVSSVVANRKTGCPKCGKRRGGVKRLNSLKNIQSRIEKRNIRFMDDEYLGAHEIHSWECLVCENIWKTKTNCILSGNGCPSCAKYGFDSSKPAILYYVKIFYKNKEYYKIGITNRTAETRFTPSERKYMSTIKTWSFKLGKMAYIEEQRILKKYSEFLYSGEKNILITGNTEIFSRDVLGVDKQ